MKLKKGLIINRRPYTVFRNGRRYTGKGLTLIELMITIVMFVILTGVIIFILRAVLLNWSSQETRAGVDISLDRGIEEAARDLREARQVSTVNNDEIRFTQDLTNFYIYYLYNASDAYPPSFTNPGLLYQLRKASLTGGIGGLLTDSGRIIITDVLSPSYATSPSDLSYSANMVTFDLSVKRGDETIRSRTRVRPRNL